MRARKNRLLAAAAIVAALVAVGAACRVWWPSDLTWIGLWLTPDQQGRCYFEKGDTGRAAERFRDPLWKGVAFYRAGNFEAAAGQLALVETVPGYFDLGDAYAHLGRLEQARASFEQALRHKPGDKEIRENLELVQSLIAKTQSNKEEEPPQGEEPTLDPDEIKVDDKGKRGKTGELEQGSLSDEQIQDLWMRRLQTTPSEFLRMKFAIQAARGPEAKKP
ncbi:MAG: tetratricopeptide repeat protein [bacterium]